SVTRCLLARVDALLPAKIGASTRSVAALGMVVNCSPLDVEISANASKFVSGQCQHTDWIGCRWLCCDSHQHLSAKRVVVVASGGNILLSSSESVSTRSIHKEPLDAGAEPQPMLGWVSHWHMREVSVAASGGHLFIRPGCLRSL